ncbi:MAG: DNA repair protein RecN [Christensenellaceae bacterium]|nr:DNA repair protein RecN [Christensenellaceae bacterium]
MLRELTIKNIALIEELCISFDDGFNVLSGETGAGKSIIIDAMGLICGERGGRELITHGAESAYVEALFDMSEALISVFRELGIDFDEAEGTVIVSRELHASGKNTCRVNGRLQTLQNLRRITTKLINIHGQNQLGEVLNENNHIAILDQVGGSDIAAAKEKTAALYADYSEVKKQLDSMRLSEAERARILDMLRYQCREIEQAKLRPGEDDEIRSRREELLNAEKIAGLLDKAYYGLSDSALSSLGTAMRALEAASEYSEKAGEIYSAIADAYYTLEDQSFELAKLKDGCNYSEEELMELEDRRHVINALCRKYGGSVEMVLKYYEESAERLVDLENAEDRIEELEHRLAGIEKKLSAACSVLTELRKKAAEAFSKEVVSELSDLGMANAQFRANFSKENYSANGADEVFFEITVNKGEPLKPLAKVVSGGEASRIMLAIKTISAEKDGIGTLIFDEIDAGISGKIAQVVAKKIAKIASIRQVICVTHLAQLAAMADANFFIEKSSDDVRTKTSIRRLDSEGVENEVARLAGGLISGSAINHAKELISEAQSEKRKLK